MAMLWAGLTPGFRACRRTRRGMDFSRRDRDAFGLQVAPTRPSLMLMIFSTEGDGGFGLFVGVDALVEADGGLQFFWMATVAEEVVPAEGLLDHQ